MKLSVLVPTYQRPTDLRRCLTALSNQTRLPDQVVVVVRDSDPTSRAVAEEAAGGPNGLPLDVVTVHTAGMISALNAGLPALKGDVLCFTDDDAAPFPDWLERIEAHYGRPDVVGVGGRDILVRYPETIEQTCRVVGRGSWYGRFVGNHHLRLEPARVVTAEILKGVNMSFRATAVAGFRFDEAFAVQASMCNEFDICYVARKGGAAPPVRPRHPGSSLHERPRRAFPGRTDPVRFYDRSHNLTFVLLKHLSWPRRLAFLAYIFLVGQRSSWGPVTLIAELVMRRRLPPWAEVRYSIVGKLAGVKSYLRTRAKMKRDDP